ncbi:MAG: hypothetical protein KDJ47_05515 [Hyphomicrobiaceae bacterium]|nr:hypothetical protein [Hyphomicrobiaceae bacterium]
MTARMHEVELLELLCKHEVLRLRGYSFAIGPKGGVVIDRWGHVRGMWRYKNDRFSWTPASHTSSVHWSEDAEAAVRYTLVALTVG